MSQNTMTAAERTAIERWESEGGRPLELARNEAFARDDGRADRDARLAAPPRAPVHGEGSEPTW